MAIRTILSTTVLALITACATDPTNETNDDGPTASEVADMYNLYLHGEYEVYVDQMASLDDKPQEYRKEMAMLMKQRYRQLQEEHESGPVACHITELRHKKGSDYCDAFLEVIYPDHSFHRIHLPLVRKNGEWRLK